MGSECFLGLGCLRTIGWLVVELFCFFGWWWWGRGGGYLECKRFLGLYNPFLGGWRIGFWVGEGFVAPVFDWIG